MALQIQKDNTKKGVLPENQSDVHVQRFIR